MGNVAIDIGKKRSHIVVEQDGEIVREGYVVAGTPQKLNAQNLHLLYHWRSTYLT